MSVAIIIIIIIIIIMIIIRLSSLYMRGGSTFVSVFVMSSLI